MQDTAKLTNDKNSQGRKSHVEPPADEKKNSDDA
jgi:hypothetical protein